MKKTFTTLEAKIEELVDEESNRTSSDRKDISGNSHFHFHTKPASFTVPKKLKPDPEYSVKVPEVTTPTGVVLKKTFE